MTLGVVYIGLNAKRLSVSRKYVSRYDAVRSNVVIPTPSSCWFSAKSQNLRRDFLHCIFFLFEPCPFREQLDFRVFEYKEMKDWTNGLPHRHLYLLDGSTLVSNGSTAVEP
jgi:hypothetical protein